MSDWAEQFRETGFVHRKGVLSDQLVASTTQAILKLAGTTLDSAGAGKWGYRHGVSKESALWDLVRSRAIAECAKSALEAQRLAYLEDSDLKIWRSHRASGWHRDSICPRFGEGPEWNGGSPYRIARVALYLQPESDAFEWGCLPGTHRAERRIGGWEKWLWTRLAPRAARSISSRLEGIEPFQDRLWLRSGPSARLPLPPTAPVWIKTSPGDVVLFDPRLIHVGGNVPARKWAVFFALGARNEHSRRHRDFFGGASLDAAGGSSRAAFTNLLNHANLAFE
jgi:hypothetical protein